MITLTLISLAALVAFHNQSVRYQNDINQTTKQLEDQKAKQRTQLEQKMHELQLQNDVKQKTIDDLNGQLRAKAAQKSLLAKATTAVVSYVAPTAYASSGTGDDGCPVDPKAFIYCHESGNSPCKINGGGINCAGSVSLACGLGQALPCSKLLAVCPDLSDYACQDNWWTTVYLARYHFSWAEAKAFWIVHRWW